MIKPKALTSLTLFFPCYNEAENVGAQIDDAVKTAEEYGIDYEVLVVDDGSRDKTAEIVRSRTAKNPSVRLIQHERNQGYGAAVRTGLMAAQKDLVFMTDGDRQFRISDIEKLFSKIDSCDVVAGFRISRRDAAHRRVGGRLWTTAVRCLFGLPIRDIDCAFKLYRRKYLQGLNLRSNQLVIHAETLGRLKRRGCRIEEIGVDHYPRTAGKATATALPRLIKSFVELLRVYPSVLSEKP